MPPIKKQVVEAESFDWLPSAPLWACVLFLVSVLLVAIIWVTANYAGNRWLLVAFHLAFLTMLALAWPRPRIDAYFFLAIFMFLGFWAKYMAHAIIVYPFVEPVGAFTDSPEQWDRVIIVSTVAALGSVCARLLYLFFFRKKGRDNPGYEIFIPQWYLRNPGLYWSIAIVISLGLYFANFHFAFFQTGVNPRLILPYSLNAVFAWTCYCGCALLFALLSGWECQRREGRYAPLVWSVCIVGIISSLSLSSRAITLFLYMAYFVALSMHSKATLLDLFRRWRWRLPALLAVSLLLSLVLVSSYRMNTYKIHDENTLMRTNASEMTIQISRSIIDRWIGLEGVMVAASSEELGYPLFFSALGEDPATGVNSIYQKLSHSPYEFLSGFTYLTLAGAPAILFFSGSLVLVFFGMACGALVLLILEYFALKITQSRFLVALLGLFMANAICQMNFPYLWLVFVFETIVAILILGLFLRWRQ